MQLRFTIYIAFTEYVEVNAKLTDLRGLLKQSVRHLNDWVPWTSQVSMLVAAISADSHNHRLRLSTVFCSYVVVATDGCMADELYFWTNQSNGFHHHQQQHHQQKQQHHYHQKQHHHEHQHQQQQQHHEQQQHHQPHQHHHHRRCCRCHHHTHQHQHRRHCHRYHHLLSSYSFSFSSSVRSILHLSSLCLFRREIRKQPYRTTQSLFDINCVSAALVLLMPGALEVTTVHKRRRLKSAQCIAMARFLNTSNETPSTISLLSLGVIHTAGKKIKRLNTLGLSAVTAKPTQELHTGQVFARKKWDNEADKQTVEGGHQG